MEIQEIYKKFGLDRNELYNSYSAAQKIVWEQALLLSIYTRQVYFSDKGNQLHQRAKLIHRLQFSGREKLKPFVLELIENGCSNTEIISFLLKLKENEKMEKSSEDDLKENSGIVEKFLKKIKPQFEKESRAIILNENEILRDLEEKQIAFPTVKNNQHPYSYYSMYKSLTDPFLIFGKILSVDLSLDGLDNQVLYWIRDYLKNKKINLSTNLFSITEYFEKDSFEKILDHINSNNFNINFYELSVYVKYGILKFLSYYARDVFSFIQNYKYVEVKEEDLHIDFIKMPTPLSEISHINFFDNELAIIFEKNTLKDLIHLGQIDSIMDGVKDQILQMLEDYYSPRMNEKNIKENNAQALKDLGLWHKKQENKFIKKTDQIPKLIASIIEFDIRNQLGFCDRDFGNNVLSPILNYKRISMQEVYILTTNLIKRCLYEQSGLDSYISTLNGVSIEEFISKYSDNSENYNYSDTKEISGDDLKISFYRNKMMSTWANEDPSSISERFKKLPSYLKGNRINFVSDIIDQQRKVKTTNIYPIDSFFPLPLWVKTLKVEF